MTTSKTTIYKTEYEDDWIHEVIIYEPDIDIRPFRDIIVNGERRG